MAIGRGGGEGIAREEGRREERRREEGRREELWLENKRNFIIDGIIYFQMVPEQIRKCPAESE